MNELKRAREQAGIKQSTAAVYLQDVDRRMNRPALSNLENGLLLPTPDLLRGLCRIYGAHPLSLYRMKDIDLNAVAREFGPYNAAGTRKRDGHRLTHKKTYRISEDVYTRLNRDVFRACGYLDGQDWFNDCVKRLIRKYEQKTKKAPSGAATPSGAKENNHLNNSIIPDKTQEGGADGQEI